jgi:tetratricopeptide (TPR) repeat protein
VRIGLLIVALALATTFSWAQDAPDKTVPDKTAPDKTAPEKTAEEKAAARDREADASSSRATRIDLRVPKDDAKNHPGSADAVEDLVPGAGDNSGIQEFHPWNPVKAAKDVDVGDFYFRRKNYKAARERYKDALYYKENDAVASFRLAVCEEKMGNKDEARKYFEFYLKILPEGPSAKEAHASLAKLGKAQ